MRYEYLSDGFIEYPENEFIEKIRFVYDIYDNNTHRGSCTVYYYHEPPRTIFVECTIYNRLLGYPVSEDGKTLFVSSWENGLIAYDIATNEVLWRLKSTRIKKVTAYSTYVAAVKYGEAILKLDLHTGEVLGQMKSGTIESSWELQAPYILVSNFRGKLSVVNTKEMSVAKAYKEKTINPNSCCSLLIQEVKENDNALIISGLEEYPNWNFGAKGQKPFERIIDTSLYETS